METVLLGLQIQYRNYCNTFALVSNTQATYLLLAQDMLDWSQSVPLFI